MRNRLVQKRLQEYGITGISGRVDGLKAKIIQFKKRSPSAIDSRALFKEKLRKLNALIVQKEKMEARRDAHRKKLGDKIDRKQAKRERRSLRREIVLGEKIKEEAKRIFAAKPYDPHKKERSKIKWG